jgi:predicted dehydrogenase
MNRYRTAIIGCGPRGTAIGRGYAAHPRTDVVALCDLSPERLSALGDALGVAARFDDLDRMLRAAAPAVVVVATGTEHHFGLAMRLLEYRVHLDLEKPLCVDLEQADALAARVKSAGVRVAVHHQGKVCGPMRAIRRAAAEGRIGALRHLRGQCKGFYGGYGLMNIGCHQLQYFTALAGPCRAVTAIATVAGRPVTPADVVAAPGGMGIVVGERITAALEFDHGVSGTLLLHRFEPRDTADSMEVLGTAGRLYWRGRAWWLPTPHFVPGGEVAWQELAPEPTPGFEPASGASAAEFAYVDELVRALDEGREHDSGLAPAIHVQEIMLGILEAAACGVRVTLPPGRRDHPLLRWRRAAGLPDPPPGPRDYAAWVAVIDHAREGVNPTPAGTPGGSPREGRSPGGGQ